MINTFQSSHKHISDAQFVFIYPFPYYSKW